MGFEPRLGRGAEQTRERLPRSAQGGAAAAAERARAARGEPPYLHQDFESLATAGLFHAQGEHGIVKVPHIAKPARKGVGTRPAGIIPSVMMKPLST